MTIKLLIRVILYRITYDTDPEILRKEQEDSGSEVKVLTFRQILDQRNEWNS